MCVVRGGNVTPGPLTRGPGRVSGYPSEGRMSPPPYAGHQLAACTHAPCAPCAPRSQVHVLGAPVSYMQTHICKVCNHMHISYGKVSCSKVCTMCPGLIYARCTCLVYKSMHILQISTKEGTSNITISFVNLFLTKKSKHFSTLGRWC